MFEKLEKMLARQTAETITRKKAYIRKGYMPTWADQTKSDNGLKEYSTPGAWDKYTAGKMTRQDAIAKATARMIKQEEKGLSATLEKLQRVADADLLDSVTIAVDWVRSATWGHNPHALVTAYTAGGNAWETAEGRASGCGYDKETAAIGTALNRLAPVLKMLYTAKEKNLAKGNKAVKAAGKRPTDWNVSNRAYLAYGAGYGVLPYFEGGTGMSSFEAVFNACGFKLKHQNHTKTTDYYYFVRGPRRADSRNSGNAVLDSLLLHQKL